MSNRRCFLTAVTVSPLTGRDCWTIFLSPNIVPSFHTRCRLSGSAKGRGHSWLRQLKTANAQTLMLRAEGESDRLGIYSARIASERSRASKSVSSHELLIAKSGTDQVRVRL